MSTDNSDTPRIDLIPVLPGDDVRRILWRFTDRPDYHSIVERARDAARGPVARAVANGARNTQEWTDEKDGLIRTFDEKEITTLGLDPENGGSIDGPKNMAFALAAFEIAWVDGGAATTSLATNLAMAPIHERGTADQKQAYLAVHPPRGKGDTGVRHGSFALTEPLPYVGVNTGVISGEVTVKEWEDGEEPILHIEKRGRFITNMAIAKFVTAAVTSGDERLKGSCMVILEHDDPGIFDRGTPSRKMVHQLSSTRDPLFSLDIPASRIIGGYSVKDGVIVPNYEVREIIAAVFRRTRITVGLMTSAKLLSAVEPVIRYQRGRFRGAEGQAPGSPRYDLGLQQKEDALHRLVDVWAAGEASASLGFAAARHFDILDPMEIEKDRYLEEKGVSGMRAQFTALRKAEKAAVELLELEKHPPADDEGKARLEELRDDFMVRFALEESIGNILVPATKLWNTGMGVNYLREAVSLIGGYGITEDCPGFIGYKWMDSQLEATYEGPEAVQRLQLGTVITSELFQSQFRNWIAEMREVAGKRPGTGACTIASGMELWLWTLQRLMKAEDASGKVLYHKQRQGVTFPMADALSWLVASRQQILDVVELAEKGPDFPSVAADLPGTLQFLTDLCHVQAARASGEASRICSELLYGYLAHPCWDDEGLTYKQEDVENLESVMPGMEACAESMGEVIGIDGTHAAKAGPCVRPGGLEVFERLRSKLDGCMTGCRLAKDRAALALTHIHIPEELDYPS